MSNTSEVKLIPICIPRPGSQSRSWSRRLHTSGSTMYSGTFGCTQDAPLRESSEQSPLLGPSEGLLSVGTLEIYMPMSASRIRSQKMDTGSSWSSRELLPLTKQPSTASLSTKSSAVLPAMALAMCSTATTEAKSSIIPICVRRGSPFSITSLSTFMAL